MKNSSRLSLRLQIRSFKNTFFQCHDLPFKGLLPDSLIDAIHKSGDIRSTVFTPLITLRAFLFQVLSSTGACKEAVAHIPWRLASGCCHGRLQRLGSTLEKSWGQPT